jgi:hypothetical protein
VFRSGFQPDVRLKPTSHTEPRVFRSGFQPDVRLKPTSHTEPRVFRSGFQPDVRLKPDLPHTQSPGCSDEMCAGYRVRLVSAVRSCDHQCSGKCPWCRGAPRGINSDPIDRSRSVPAIEVHHHWILSCLEFQENFWKARRIWSGMVSLLCGRTPRSVDTTGSGHRERLPEQGELPKAWDRTSATERGRSIEVRSFRYDPPRSQTAHSLIISRPSRLITNGESR